ncbi:hypothetical protein HOE04_00480 [archaeon]|nr:hypothetical protein [archaeon]
MKTKNIFLITALILLLAGSLGLVVGAQIPDYDQWKNDIQNGLDKYINGEDSSQYLNSKWESADNSENHQKSLLNNLNTEQTKALWDNLEKENRQTMFDNLGLPEKVELWDAHWENNFNTLEGDIFSKTQKNRQDLLDSLKPSQKDTMLSLIAQNNNPSLQGEGKVDLSQGITEDAKIEYKIDANGEESVVLTDSEGKKLSVQLSNLPETLTNLKIELGLGSGELSVIATDTNKNKVVLRNGHSIKKIPTENPNTNQWQIVDENGNPAFIADFGDATDAQFLAGSPGTHDGIQYPDAYHIWAEGHGGEGKGAEMIIENQDGTEVRVFPAIGEDYAFAKKLGTPEQRVYNVQGNLMTSEGFSAYSEGNENTFNFGTTYGLELDLTDSKYQDIIHIFHSTNNEEGETTWTITPGNNVEDRVSFAVVGSLVNQDKFQETTIGENEDSYTSYTFKDNQDYVPRQRSESTTKSSAGTTRVRSKDIPLDLEEALKQIIPNTPEETTQPPTTTVEINPPNTCGPDENCGERRTYTRGRLFRRSSCGPGGCN